MGYNSCFQKEPGRFSGSSGRIPLGIFRLFSRKLFCKFVDGEIL